MTLPPCRCSKNAQGSQVSGTARGEGSRVAYVSVVESIPPNLAISIKGSTSEQMNVVPGKEPEGSSTKFSVRGQQTKSKCIVRILIHEEQTLRGPFRNVGRVLDYLILTVWDAPDYILRLTGTA